MQTNGHKETLLFSPSDTHSKSPTPEAATSSSARKSESDPAPISSSSRILGDSLVGDGTKLGLKTVVKRSVIGKNCQVSRSQVIGFIIVAPYTTQHFVHKIPSQLVERCDSKYANVFLSVSLCEIKAGTKKTGDA